ncbi:hypothetical protein K439DRAFT_1624233 [Ramaria rubella]|nr:hypothetical protein K439DRAFT_1624233 [Ramaria rubella]
MSAQEELAQIIQEQSDIMAFTYVDVAAFALLTYDSLLTFPSELRFIWHKKFKLGTILYLLARYPALLQLLITVYWDFGAFPSSQLFSNTDIQTCNSVLYFACALEFLPVIGVQGLLFARAYAIASHKKLVFIMLALLGTTAIVLSMIAIPNSNCISTSNIFALYVIKFLPIDIHSSNAVTTLNGVFTILFDTAVFFAIIENTIGLLQLQKGVPGLQRNTLSKLVVQQDPVTKKALRPTLQGIVGPLQNCLSTIIICHSHLDLQQRKNHPNGSNTSHSLPLGSFHAVKERIHRAIVDEFGDLSFNEFFGTEGSQEDIELQALQSASGAAEIDLQEFPWAGGDIGDEEAGPVASGEFLAFYGTVQVLI